jgi:exosortase A-associated hydrolase 2
VAYGSTFIRNRRGASLFVADERPEAPGLPAEVWIICSPILEEKNVAHGAFVTLARALAPLGVRAVRVDYEGHGDSDGDTANLGLDDWTDDVCDVVEWLRLDASTPVTMMGCRAGALIAARAAARIHAARLVAWCPVIRGDDHLQDLLRLNLTTQMAVHKKIQQDRPALMEALAAGQFVNIVGWTMGRALLNSLIEASLPRLLNVLRCPVEILDLTRRSGDAAPDAVAALASARVAVRGAQGLPFWIDGNYIDYQQAGLVQATVTLAKASRR